MAEVSPLLPGDPAEVGGHRLEGRIGAGGQGVVYLSHTEDGAPVAVKLLHEGVSADETVRARFAREVRAAGSVAPFCVAQVLGGDLEAARPYIVSEYVAGPSLRQAIAEQGPRSGSALHRLAVTTATALAAVHEAGIVHRDFKPDNVLLGADGPRVIDFGIARDLGGSTLTHSPFLGTPAYMSPEQIAGDGVGPASDVFAWGCVIVFAATGGPPFGTGNLPATTYRVLHAEPNLGELAGPLRALAAAALSKDPADRPAMRDILLRLLGQTPAPAPAPAPSNGPARSGPPVPHALEPVPRPPAPGAPGSVFSSYDSYGHASADADPAGPGSGGSRRRRLLLGGTAAIAGAGTVAATLWLLPGAGDARTATQATSTAWPSATVTTSGPASGGDPTSGDDPTRITTPAPTSASTSAPASEPSPWATPTAETSPGAAAPAVFPASFAGVWRGTVDYRPGAEETLVVTVRKGAGTVSEQYVEGHCAGTLKLTELSGDVARLKRVSMKGNCVGNGTVTLTLSPDGILEFAYRGHGENRVTKDIWFTGDARLERQS